MDAATTYSRYLETTCQACSFRWGRLIGGAALSRLAGRPLDPLRRSVLQTMLVTLLISF